LATVPPSIRNVFRAELAKANPGDKVAIYQLKGDAGEALYQVSSWNRNGFGQLFNVEKSATHRVADMRFSVKQERAEVNGVPGLWIEATQAWNRAPTGGTGFSDVSPND
jgi:hypothetical protein